MESPSQFSPNEYIFWDNVKEPYEVSPDALTAMPTWMQCGANNHRVDSFSSVYHNKFDEAGQYTPTNDASMYPVALDDCPTSNTDADSSVQDEKNNPSSIAPFLVPFARNSSFVGRSDMLHWIDRSLSSSDQHNRVALTGPSGIGKTQIAIEYAYRFRDAFPGASIFWISASSRSRFFQSYDTIARGMGVSSDTFKVDDIVSYVYDRLSSEETGKWLLIIDGADDGEIFHPQRRSQRNTGYTGVTGSRQRSGGEPLSCYIPQRQDGSILITTIHHTGNYLVEDPANIRPVRRLGKSSALHLLNQSLAKVDVQDSDEKRLVKACNYHPLAITCAASFLNMNSHCIAVPEYLQLLSERKKIERSYQHQKHAGGSVEIGSLPHYAVSACMVTFKHIGRVNRLAAKLLSLVAVVDAESVPQTLLHRPEMQQDDVQQALASLSGFSVLTREGDNNPSYQMHQLVQRSARFWLETNGTGEAWCKEAVGVLRHDFPNRVHDISGMSASLKTSRILVPHALKVLEMEHSSSHTLDCYLLHSSVACYASEIGDFPTAQWHLERAVDVSEHVFPDDQFYRFSSLKHLAMILRFQNKFAQAEATQHRMLHGFPSLSATTSPDTLAATEALVGDQYANHITNFLHP